MSLINGLLALLGEIESDAIAVHEERCISVRNRNADCLRCVDACTSGALAYCGNELAVEPDRCIGCGMCSQACPWNMPRVDSETGVSTKCISCGRCAEQCPNGAIKFIDWEDIAQKVIDQGVVRTTTLVQA